MHSYLKMAAICLSLASVGLQAQTWEDSATWKNVHPDQYQNIVYGKESGQEQVLDVYTVPSAKPTPVIVYFHGGAWWKGERPASYGGFRAFLAAGISVVTVEYRLTGVAPAPAAVQDVRCSLAWVKANAEKYHFDTSRVIVYGTSAGGHLALMAGMLPTTNDVDLPQCRDVPKVAAILDFYGPYDLSPTAMGAYKSPSVGKWLGSVPDQLAYGRKMSPSSYVKPGQPPTFIVHGDADPVVPYQQSVELQHALDKVKVPNGLYTVHGGGHGNFSEEEKPKTMLLSLEFLKTQHIIE